MIFETHAHYDDEAFEADREELQIPCRKTELTESSMPVLRLKV